MDTMIARAFRIVSMATAVAFFAACAGQEPRHSGGVTASPSGGEVVTNMLARFNNLDIQCGGGTNPRLTCNGVYMRATKRGEGFHVWNPNPDSPNKNSVSFSWLNKRGSFGGLVFGYDNGFTLLPSDQAWQAGLDPVSALCLFPYDAATWNRSDDGCGSYPGIPGSGPCQAQALPRPISGSPATELVACTGVSAVSMPIWCGPFIRDGKSGPNSNGQTCTSYTTRSCCVRGGRMILACRWNPFSISAEARKGAVRPWRIREISKR